MSTDAGAPPVVRTVEAAVDEPRSWQLPYAQGLSIAAFAVGMALLAADPVTLPDQDHRDVLRWAQWAVMGVAPVVAASALSTRLFARPLGWLTGLYLWALATAVMAGSPGITFVRSLGFAATALAGVWLAERWGWRAVAASVMGFFWVFLAAGFLATRVLDVEAEAAGRLQLLASEHNQLARHAALGTVAAAYALFRSSGIHPVIGILTMAAGVVTMGLTESRTAMAAAFLGLVVIVVRRVGALALAAIAAAAVVALIVVAASDIEHELIDITARGGSVENLSTATGRTSVWAAMIDQSLEEPITGTGTGSAREIVVAASQDGKIDWAASNTQNLLVHELVEHGVVGAFLLVAAFVSYARATLESPRSGRDGLMMVIIVDGFSEALLDRPEPSLVVLAACLAHARRHPSGVFTTPPAAGVPSETHAS